MITPQQQSQVLDDVRQLILAAGVRAEHLRPQTAGAGSFYGSHEQGFLALGQVPVELQDLASRDLVQQGVDAAACVLPDCGVLENDVLVISGCRFRVTEVLTKNLFGVVTHLELHLERDRRHG